MGLGCVALLALGIAGVAILAIWRMWPRFDENKTYTTLELVRISCRGGIDKDLSMDALSAGGESTIKDLCALLNAPEGEPYKDAIMFHLGWLPLGQESIEAMEAAAENEVDPKRKILYQRLVELGNGRLESSPEGAENQLQIDSDRSE